MFTLKIILIALCFLLILIILVSIVDSIAFYWEKDLKGTVDNIEHSLFSSPLLDTDWEQSL